MYDLGSRLKEIRVQHGLTQKALSKLINKSISAIRSYETNVQMPPPDVLISIASVYCVSLDYFVGFNNDSTYSAKELRPEQKEIVGLLFSEFYSASSHHKELSPLQIIVSTIFFAFYRISEYSAAFE